MPVFRGSCSIFCQLFASVAFLILSVHELSCVVSCVCIDVVKFDDRVQKFLPLTTYAQKPTTITLLHFNAHSFWIFYVMGSARLLLVYFDSLVLCCDFLQFASYSSVACELDDECFFSLARFLSFVVLFMICFFEYLEPASCADWYDKAVCKTNLASLGKSPQINCTFPQGCFLLCICFFPFLVAFVFLSCWMAPQVSSVCSFPFRSSESIQLFDWNPCFLWFVHLFVLVLIASIPILWDTACVIVCAGGLYDLCVSVNGDAATQYATLDKDMARQLRSITVCMYCIALHWIELNWIELNWIALNWIELNWIELNWLELNCINDCFAFECDIAIELNVSWFWMALACAGFHWIDFWFLIEFNWLELNCICIELNWIELNWIELNWLELNWIELHCIESNWIELNWIELTWIELHCIALHWIELNCIALNWIELNWIEGTFVVLPASLKVETEIEKLKLACILWR